MNRKFVFGSVQHLMICTRLNQVCGDLESDTYTLFSLMAGSAVGAFLFLGAGSSSKVQFCLWKSHRTHEALSALLNTHRLFRRRHASQGRSGLFRELGVSPMRELVGEVDIEAVSSGGMFLCIAIISANDHLRRAIGAGSYRSAAYMNGTFTILETLDASKTQIRMRQQGLGSKKLQLLSGFQLGGKRMSWTRETSTETLATALSTA